MTLDVGTTTLMVAFVTLASGCFLGLHSLMQRGAVVIVWWSVANTVLAVGIGLLAFAEVLPWIVRDVGVTLLFQASTGLTWVAARVFEGRSVQGPLVVIVLTMLVIATASGSGAVPIHPIAINAVASSAFYVAAAFSLSRPGREALWGRWPLVALLVLHAIAVLLVAAGHAATEQGFMPPIGVMGVIHFVAPVYAIGSAILLITMVNERSERILVEAALHDTLTGLFNRRGFLDSAQRRLARSAADGVPVCLVAFDLDHFKRVNDRFGHAVGDEVLRVFGSVVRNGLRPNDTAGRIGGEEFAAILPGCSADAAVAIAHRVNRSFAAGAEFIAGQKVGATVSIGVAEASEEDVPLSEVMAHADEALYAAKALGRNRVSMWQGTPALEGGARSCASADDRPVADDRAEVAGRSLDARQPRAGRSAWPPLAKAVNVTTAAPYGQTR